MVTNNKFRQVVLYLAGNTSYSNVNMLSSLTSLQISAENFCNTAEIILDKVYALA